MGIWTRDRAGQSVTGLTHHSDKGVQYVAIRYTPSVLLRGWRGRLGRFHRRLIRQCPAEAFNLKFKAELVRKPRALKNIDDLEIATAEYIDWFNHRRLHGEIGTIPPIELEGHLSAQPPAPVPADAALASL